MIADASSIPPTIGTLRARLAEPVRVSSQSDSCPPISTPTDAPIYGRIVHRPAFLNVMPRAFTRYVGNHVTKNTCVELPPNWPIEAPMTCRCRRRVPMLDQLNFRRP